MIAMAINLIIAFRVFLRALSITEIEVETMINFEAIDAKISRARVELRTLKADIASFCDERARLIMPVGDGDEVEWVYRGAAPNPPIDWSIRVGEFAYNLRSSLDHLAWQLVTANGQCPGQRNAFPVHKRENQDDFNQKLEGMSCEAADYIRSVQPYQGDPAGVGHRLAMLHAICNIDKHRRIIVTDVRWTGIEPRLIDRLSWSDQIGTSGFKTFHLERPSYGPLVLAHGRCLFRTSRLSDSEYFVIPIEAVFAEEDIEGEKWGDSLSVPETLSECIAGVEIVVAHFKMMLGSTA